MGSHRKRSSRGRVIDPILVGFLLAGVSFVGIALAAQEAAPTILSAGASSRIGEVPVLPVPVPIDEAANPPLSTASVPTEDASELQASTVVSRSDRMDSGALPRSVPVTLDIDAIGVHSRLHDLGLDASGAVDAPSGARYNEAAWYRHSPTPGAMGPSIILGHVDSAADGPSVFFRLGELVRGDRLSVTRIDGSVARFRVDEVRRYPKTEFPTERVYGDLDHAGLRLITCGGAFNQASGHYEDNIVVFARLEN